MNKRTRVNDRIRAKEVRLVGIEAEQLGIRPLDEALKLAKDEGLDLVEVAETANPPVCRIMDFSKFKYEQSKKEKEARKRSHTVHLKQIRCKVKIEEHDYQVKLRNAQRFLERGDRVKINVMLRGREQSRPQLAQTVLARFTKDISEIGIVEKALTREGRFMHIVVAPRS